MHEHRDPWADHAHRLHEWGDDKPFRELIQLDGFIPGVDGWDEVVHPDTEGYCVMACQVEDPRRTGTVDFIPVRVQVVPGTPTRAVLDLLDRMRNWVAGGFLDDFPRSSRLITRYGPPPSMTSDQLPTAPAVVPSDLTETHPVL